MAELSGKIEYPGIRRQITANGDDPRVSYGVLSGPRNASGFRYPSDAVITVDGHGTYTIPKNTGLYIWQGSQAATDATKAYQMDLTTKRWRIFYLPDASRLYACPEQDYATVSGSTDVLRVEYQTQAAMWRRSQIKFRPCISLAPLMSVAIGNLAGGDALGSDSAVRFTTLNGLYVASDGSLYAIDAGNHKIKKRSGGVWTEVLTDAQITTLGSFAASIAVANNGDIYYSVKFDGGHTQVKRLPFGSSTPVVILGSTSGNIRTFPVVATTYNWQNFGLALSLDQQRLYIAEEFLPGGRIMVLDLASGIVDHFAGDAIDQQYDPVSYVDPARNASRLTAKLPGPRDLAVQPDGSILALSFHMSSLSRINPDDSVTRITYAGTTYSFGDTGTQIDSGFYMGDGGPAYFVFGPPPDMFGPLGGDGGAGDGSPVAVAVSECFDICIAQQRERVVRVIDKNLNLRTLIGGLPADPVSLRAIPRGQGGGVWVACGNAIVTIQ